MSQLDELKKYTTVVADTGDIESIKKFAPQDATTNPSLVLKAAQLPQYQPLIADAIGKARRQGGSAETQLINACDQVAVDIGSEVLRHVPGRISTEVDARFAWDRGMCVAKARKLIQLYEKNGIGPERILIKLAATWEGIRAAGRAPKRASFSSRPLWAASTTGIRSTSRSQPIRWTAIRAWSLCARFISITNPMAMTRW